MYIVVIKGPVVVILQLSFTNFKMRHSYILNICENLHLLNTPTGYIRRTIP